MNPKKFLKSEPVVSAAVITALIGALLRLLISFGVDISSEQVEAILDVVTLAAPIIGAIIARRYVFTQEAIDENYTADDEVVEYAIDGHVLAGKASELPTNTHIREVGDLDASV